MGWLVGVVSKVSGNKNHLWEKLQNYTKGLGHLVGATVSLHLSNLNDVKIVKALDEKLKLIDLVKGVSHLGRVPYEEVYYSSRYIEGAMLTYLRKLDLVAPSKRHDASYDDSAGRFSGAYVKDPNPGRYEWVYDLDLTSLYPSIIMSINISPETKIGKVEGYTAESHMKSEIDSYVIEDDNGKRYPPMDKAKFEDFTKKMDLSIALSCLWIR